MQNRRFDAIIIGAGAGGLACGLKLALGGRKVLLIEKQPLAGGFATLFKRKGFAFESSVHCVDALGEGQEVREFLKECRVDGGLEFIELKDFCRIIYPGHDFIADFKRDNFVSYLKKEFPQGEKNIERLFRRVDKFYREFNGFSKLNLPFWLKAAMMPFFFSEIIRASSLTAGQFIARYTRDERLNGLLTNIWGFMGLPPERLSALYFLIVFTAYYYQPTQYVRGGFIRLFEAMLNKIREAGGEVIFNTAVTRIITDKGRAIGVATDKGEEFSARVVISNANAIDTLSKFPDDPKLKDFYAVKLSRMEKSISAFQVYLGLSVPPANLGMDHFMFFISNTYEQNRNYAYNLKSDYLNCSISIVDHSRIDPSLAPPGKGSLLIFCLDNYANWEGLGQEEYQAKKKEAADKLIARAEKYLPGLSSHIEVMEIATPRTMERFGAAPQGAIYGFAQTLTQSSIMRLSQKTKIKGLFLAGGWTQPGGGVHACFVSGADAADLALRALK